MGRKSRKSGGRVRATAEQSSEKKAAKPHRSHSEETVYKCDQCDKTFTRISTLFEHERVHSGDKPYKCDKCNKTFSRKYTLNQHKITHSGEKPYKCRLCKKGFTQRGNLDRHLKLHGEDSKSQHFQSGKASAKNVHSGEKPYKCGKCDKTFTRKFSLNQHKVKHSEEKPFKCRLCKKGFTQRDNLGRHVKLHCVETKSQDFQSGKASAKNVNYADFKTDIKVPPGKGATLTCVTRVLLHRGKLFGHQQIHSAKKSKTSLPSIKYKDEKPYKCEKGDLIVHEKTHTEEKKPYLCYKCNEAFVQKEDLNWHFRTKHRNEKIFRKQLAAKYRVTHNADKVYQCGVCNKKFANKVVLKLHRRKHIGEKPFQCSKCGKVFKLYDDLKMHLGTHK